MSIASAKIVKDPKSGDFFLVGPGFLKEKVEGSLSEAWEKLESEYVENLAFLKEAGVQDEVEQLNLKKIFGKGFWLESLVKGLVIMVPILIGFFLFTFAVTNQFSKLTGKINDLIKPYSDRASREELGYTQTLERYRPYIFETLKVIKEESAKAELAAGKKALNAR